MRLKNSATGKIEFLSFDYHVEPTTVSKNLLQGGTSKKAVERANVKADKGFDTRQAQIRREVTK